MRMGTGWGLRGGTPQPVPGYHSFSTGDYLSGALVLRDNVTLHLAAGATLWGSRNIADYNPRHPTPLCANPFLAHSCAI